MPMGLCQLIFLILTALIATYIRSSRIMSMILNVVVSVIGVVLIYTLDDSQKVVKLVGLCFVATFAANIPLSLSIITSNVAGTTKRSMLSVSLFIAYCVGNIVGPQFYYASQEPVYSVCALAISDYIVLFTYQFTIIEWDRSDCMRVSSWSILPRLFIRLLYLGEQETGSATWSDERRA